MMHKVSSLKLLIGGCLLLSLLGSTRALHASTSYPPELQKALQQQFPGQAFCVPQCIACHVTNEGGFGTLNVFGENLKTYGNVLPAQPSKLVGWIDAYFKATPPPNVPAANTLFLDGTTRPSFDADRDGASDYTELQRNDSPSESGPAGVGDFCPADAATYGCFARVAAAPPPADRVGLFAAALAVLGLAAFRRRSRDRRA